MVTKTALGQIAVDTLKQFPQTPTRTLARMIHKDNPKVFRTIEHARKVLRDYRGASGDKTRKDKKNTLIKESVRTKEEAEKAKHITTIPDSDAPDFLPYVIPDIGKNLVLADFHLPYHHRGAIERAIADGKKRGTKVVFLNGDIIDFYQTSRWMKDMRNRSIKGELELAKQVLQYIREQLEPELIVWKFGNHEDRYWKYMLNNAPALVGVESFDTEKMLTREVGEAEYVGEKRVVMIGGLSCVHGHEFVSSVMSPVNAARGFFMRAKGNVLGAHYHQTSEHLERTIKGHIIGAYSIGCLCDLYPQYAPLNRWNHGYAVVEVSGNEFEVDNVKLF